MKTVKTINTEYLAGDKVVLYQAPKKETDTIINSLVKDTIREVRQLTEQSFYNAPAKTTVWYKLSNNNYSPELYTETSLAPDIESALTKFYATFEKDLTNLKLAIKNRVDKEKYGDSIDIWGKMREKPELYQEIYALFEADYKAKNKKGKK